MIGKSIKIFEELNSTNSFVKMNVSNLDSGSIIVARKQTEGRGRRDNKWVSEEGNLYFSVLLKTDIYRDRIFRHIVQSSVSIIKTLNHFNIQAQIKYPNDCLVEGKKISGVLIESLGSSKLDFVIIGIGININQINFNDLKDKATSIKKLIKSNVEVESVLKVFINEYNELLKRNYEEIFGEYLKHSVVINKHIIYKDEEYKIINVEQDGTIIIRNKLIEQRVAYSEISLKEFY